MTYEVFVEDMTEQRALQRQLQQAQTPEAIARLDDGMAHDFNSALLAPEEPEQSKALARQQEDETVVSSDVFISHASGDYDFARRFADELQMRGFSCWLYEADLLTGKKWTHRIFEAIESSRFCIVVLSRNSTVSTPRISREWESIQAYSWRRPEVPICSIRIDDVDLPPFLRKWQSIGCNRDASDVGSAAARAVALFSNRIDSTQRNEQEALGVQGSERFIEIQRVTKDLMHRTEKDSGD